MGVSEFRASDAAQTSLRIYNIGNNLHHEFIYDELMETPGVTIFHDFCLNHFITEKTLARGDADAYISIMERCHGVSGRRIAEARVIKGLYNESLGFMYDVNHDAIEHSKGVAVHSNWARNRVIHDWPGKMVAKIEFPVVEVKSDDTVEKIDVESLRGDAAIVIGMLGFLTPPKQVNLVLRALGRAKSALPDFKLLIVGEVADLATLRFDAERNGLSENLVIAGFVEFESMPQYLSLCDFFFSLRYPSAGETSAALYRILEAGKPAIVFDYGPFGDIDDRIVEKVPLDTRDEAPLADAVIELAHDRGKREKIGSEARSYVHSFHDASISASQLINFADLCYEY
jgi:glycosyltransferase involved in cell wall biosynthesis